jgi:hypothetical protein
VQELVNKLKKLTMRQQMIPHRYRIQHQLTVAITGRWKGTARPPALRDVIVVPLTDRFRLVAASLVPLTVLPMATGSLNPVTDGIFGALIVAHSHIGFQSCIIDYFPSRRIPVLRRTLMWTLNAATVLVLIGLYEFETNDVGITEAVKRVWRA